LNYYVYYKIEPARAAALKPQVEAMFARIEKQTGVRGRWMRRRDDPGTYMEVYEDVRDEAAFEAALKAESAALGLQRKTELFQSA
jgi:quinol monooxygenase YgiN